MTWVYDMDMTAVSHILEAIISASVPHESVVIQKHALKGSVPTKDLPNLCYPLTQAKTHCHTVQPALQSSQSS